jgi:hypothetical protein
VSGPLLAIIDELVQSSGYDLEIGTVYLPDCATGWLDRVRIQLCANDSEVTLAMAER